MTSESLPIETGLGGASAASAVSPWARLGLAFAASALAGAALLAALLVGIQLAYAGRALPGVAVSGIDLSGLTRAEAAQRLTSGLPSLGSGTVALVVGDETVTLGYETLGRQYDTDGILDRAFAVGREGDPLARGLAELRGLVRGSPVAPAVRWDDNALTASIQAAARRFDKAAVDATVTRDAKGTFVVADASYGRRFDQAAAIASVRAILAAPDAPSQVTVDLKVEPVLPRVLTGQAEFARYLAELYASADLKVHDGGDTWSIKAADIRSWITFGSGANGGLRVQMIGPSMAASLTTLAKQVNRAPKDAAFLAGKNGAIVGVVEGANGRTLDIAGTMTAIDGALASYTGEGPAPNVQLAVMAIEPKLTTAEANKVAPLMTRIGTWTTYYPPGEGNFWGANIYVPAKIISGTVVPAGSWFSFWDTVGIPTAAQGYGPGGVIVNGHSDPTGAFAGGICSASTTLFNAALRAGLQMGIRNNHYYYIPRYPLGLDATVWMYTWTNRGDMTFRNDTKYPILIRSFNSYGVVRFDIYGVPDGRTVSFSKPVVKNVVKAVDNTVYVTTLSPGVEKRVEFPHDGMDVWVTRTVTQNGTVIHQETYYSDYKKVDGELDIGVAPSATPAPTPAPSADALLTAWV